MKKITVLASLLFMLIGLSAFAQTNKIVGKWYTIDEEGRKKSLVSIYQAPNGEYEGVIVKLLTGDPNRLCTKCTGAEKDKSVMGMKFIKNLKADGEKLTSGTILDPLDGKIYSCSMSFDKKTGKLKVRGSLDGWGLIGRNQTWEPAIGVD
jgi:uncharacterized protein (DUF2147 family)